MKRVIFTTYDDIESANTDELTFVQKPVADKANGLLVSEYKDRLIENKSEYAKSIGVDFIFFKNTMKDFSVDPELENEMPFTRVNLYKHYLMDQLADSYDEICYVDMDVLFSTDLNIFDEHDLSKGIHIKGSTIPEHRKDKTHCLFEQIGMRSPTIKYHITKDLLDGKDNWVMNTGIVLGQSKFIKQIQLIDRTKEANDKIQKIKTNFDENFNALNLEYYPNNESIFSYILEKYEIPYVLLDDSWHMIYSEKPRPLPEKVHCSHFINKQFDAFFKEKTKCIFSIHIHIPDHMLDSPKSPRALSKNKSKIAQEQFALYEKQLRENHESYAKDVGADYKVFGWDEEYEEFRKRFTFLTEYNIINLYKIWLLDKLTHEFDHVMYVDLDVVFNQNENVFNYVPCDYSLCVLGHDRVMVGVRNEKEYYDNYKADFRSPHAKYWNTHAMLTEEGLSTEDVKVFNTGVLIASRYAMEKLDYFSDIDDVMELMKDLQEDEFSMYPKNIKESFGYDNETIFSYKVVKNAAPVYNLIGAWHHVHHTPIRSTDNAFDINSKEWQKCKDAYDVSVIDEDAIITHFISKNFSLAFNK